MFREVLGVQTCCVGELGSGEVLNLVPDNGYASFVGGVEFEDS